ncbi:DWNN domain-containing protein [Cantharellus anzutake]|uniref:DWNN domain-containing protein n=1 Tax=Cantharellus anzutake TaxID=1750568 RepID=UPI0019032F1C|nr:DWNN domain-containing protein [Cantharellus anzutake]KAF8327187.1 DWNN domain-containing protein [Cantharellus anzutake]
MASSVSYKFKSQKNESKIAFDGTGISVFDLKKEMILANNFGKAVDFDLLLYDQAGKEYTDDNFIIPRSSSVVAKRMPASKPGKGRAANYTAGKIAQSTDRRNDQPQPTPMATSWRRTNIGSMSKRFDGKDEKIAANKPPQTDPTPRPAPENDEQARIRAMFQATSEHWEETQERMKHATPIFTSRGGGPKRPLPPQQQFPLEPRPLPPGYICHRCNKKGHWIHDCPTNDDRDFDNRPRVKKTTGIPRSFLKSVELTGDTPQPGVMITPEGGFVVAQPDSETWKKQTARRPGMTEVELRERPPSDPTLQCPICNKLFREAVKTPCCSKTFCEECVQTHLLERDFSCPGCQEKISTLDMLIPDVVTRGHVKNYTEEEIAKSEEAANDLSEIGKTSKSPELGDTQTNSGQADGEEFYDAQPGLSNTPTMPLQDDIPSLQAQMAQLMIMMQSPAILPQVRMQLDIQFQELSMRLNQLQVQHQQFYSGMGGGPIMGMGTGMALNMTMGGMDGMLNNNYVGGNRTSGYQRFHQQPQNEAESPYQRLPVNPRRRLQKRDRPEEFLEANGIQKIPRFYG